MSTNAIALAHDAHPADAPEFDEHPMRLAPVSAAECKTASVLFTDVNGSMSLSHSLDPEEWWSTMAELFELTCEGVYRFGGWVGGFTGDGISAVFESPAGTPDHARRACDAALWLRGAIDTMALQLQSDRGFELAVRIGINSGQILAGTIGGRYCSYHTASGYSVALAKRMESIAKAGRIYMTEATAALAGQGVIVRALGALEVKGAQAPVNVFELVAGTTTLNRRARGPGRSN